MEIKCKNLLFEIISELREIIYSEQTKIEARLKSGYFTRNRKMPFPDLLIFILADLIGSLNTELNDFFQINNIKRKVIDESSFSEARSHMNDSPFRKMFKIVRNRFVDFERQELPQGVHNMIWCGCDGSWLTLPNIPFLGNKFGIYGKGQSSPTARMGLVFDSTNHFIYEGCLGPLKINEKEMALDSIRELKNLIPFSQTVFIFDRGYTGLGFIKELNQLNARFIIRVREKFNGLQDLDYNSITKVYFPGVVAGLRAAKFYLDSQIPETLVTNLDWPSLPEFKELYYLRWPVEIEFYFIKRVLRLEDFNGFLVNSIYQNFWAALTLSNIASIIRIGADAQIKVVRINKNNKYEYQANFSETITGLHYLIIKSLMEEDENQRRRYINQMFELAEKYVIPVRKDRIVARNQTRSAFNHFNQKVH